jgi:uncharacterized protein YukJ
MPLDKYGVLSGSLQSHHRDAPDNQGQWFHVHLLVGVNGVPFDCAIDVDSHQSNTGVEWRVVPIRAADMVPMITLSSGYHPLAFTSTFGTLDYYRSNLFRVRRGCVFVMMPDAITRMLLATFEGLLNGWQKGNHEQASVALEGILHPGKRCLVWGEPFTSGNGMHNVHQNQGDPAGSKWWAENATWQDGGTIAEQPGGRWVAFISKFTTQAYRTDDQGHPLP